jgi:hypothetical protein
VTVADLDGLMLESKYGELTYLVKGPLLTQWRDGFPKQEPKIIAFEFDRYICEIGPAIRRMELTDEDKEYVARRITFDFADPHFTDMWEHVPPKVEPPWPSYEDAHPNAIPGLAKQIGMVDEALAYEQRREGGPRESVVKKLTEGQESGLPVEEDDLAAV